MENIRLIGRNSPLSLLQLEKVKDRIQRRFPGHTVQIITRSSLGDALQDVPLHTVEGSDFFTQDIFDALDHQQADIAVHSLKDMSSEHFFGNNVFAVVDRDDTRDVAIFHPQAEKKLQRGETLIIGTCSPRREEMATVFLKKALPYFNHPVRIETRHIRGNVDTRLRKLDTGEYDGIILATAGINRLLASHDYATSIRFLLTGKRIMLLPLIECVPAPCQGAIVAEAIPGNPKAVDILNAINDASLMQDCITEKLAAKGYGTGCSQKFGVNTIRYGSEKVVYAAGRDERDQVFSQWNGLPGLDVTGKELFSTTDHMGRFFQYDYPDFKDTIEESAVYVANYKAIQQQALVEQLQQKRVWVAGTKTWFELAKKGIWVEGSADAFGLAFLEKCWQMPLIKLLPQQLAIITHAQSADSWRNKQWKVYTTYSLIEKSDTEMAQRIHSADIIFWTSFRQYAQYRSVLRAGVVHACSYGETAIQLKEAGIHPVVFPTIKAFQAWRQTTIHSRSVA